MISAYFFGSGGSQSSTKKLMLAGGNYKLRYSNFLKWQVKNKVFVKKRRYCDTQSGNDELKIQRLGQIVQWKA